MIRSLIKEYGLLWLFYRIIYIGKLKLLSIFPNFEILFEKKVVIKRMDIYKCHNLKEIESFLMELPEKEKIKIVEEADKILIGKLQAFSSLELDYGNPINWEKNPITSQKLSLKEKWYRIPDFNEKRGDIKVIWESSRMTQLLKLSRAYILTKDKKYYLNFSFQIKEWYEKNRYSYGPNYKCGQESALRMINILISSSIFKEYDLLTEEDKKYIKKIIKDSYKKIYSNFYYAKNCIKNNHTISETVGLIIGAWCSKDNRSLKKYFCFLEEELDRQFLSDGGYIQFSFNYQRLVLQLIEVIFSIKKELKLEFNQKIINKLEKSVLLLKNVINKNGDIPNYGSNDGALIFPVTSCDYRDFRATINTLYYFIKGKHLFEKGLFMEEIYWFSPIEEKKLSSKEKKYIPRKSTAYQKSGIYTIVNDEDSFMMIIAQSLKSRPSQMDQLHIDLWHNNLNILCDTGTYSYADKIGKELCLTKGHNTIKVENIEQMEKRGAFLIYNWPILKDIKFKSNNFVGKYYFKSGYEQKREILLDNDQYFIKDEIKIKKKELIGRKVEVLLHTPCEIIIEGQEIKLLNEEKSIVASILANDKIKIEKGIRSLYYLKKEEINIIKFMQNIKKENKFEYKIRLY